MIHNFRSAFNGFNRDDVVHYLEFLNNKHSSQIAQLTSDADYLRQQLNAVQKEDRSEEIAGLESRCAELGDQLTAAQEATAALEKRCAELEKALEEARNQPPKVIASPAPAFRAEQELEAYRRAERAERVAKERAELVYRQTNSILSQVTARVDDAAGQISDIVEQIGGQLEQLQSAVNGSKQALRDAAATVYSIRPTEEI